MNFMATRLTIFLCLLLLTFQAIAGNSVHMSLLKAMRKKSVALAVTSVGGHLGKCLKMTLTNQTSDELVIDVDPGLVFQPLDSSYQKLVANGFDTIVIPANGKAEAKLRAYCGKLSAACPKPELPFKFQGVGDTDMIKCLRFLHENSNDSFLTQYAVWFYTDNYNLNSVFDYRDPVASEGAVDFICKQKKMKKPEYYMQSKMGIHYNEPLVYSKQTKAYVNLIYGHEGYRHMHVRIYKENGELYKEVHPNEVIDKTGHYLTVEMNTASDPKGTYDVQLRDESMHIWMQKRIVLDGTF